MKNPEFGSRLKSLARERGESQSTLARKLGVPQPLLSEYLSYLHGNGNTEKYVASVGRRCAKRELLGGMNSLSDFNANNAEKVLSKLRSQGLSQESINHHVMALRIHIL